MERLEQVIQEATDAATNCVDAITGAPINREVVSNAEPGMRGQVNRIIGNATYLRGLLQRIEAEVKI